MKQLLPFRNLYFLLIILGSAIAARGQQYCPVNINLEQGVSTGWKFDTAKNFGTGGLSAGGSVSPITGRHTVTTGPAVDYYGGFPIVDPIGGTYSLKVGNDNTNAEVDRASYKFTVPASINNYSLIYRYAVVFENPAHIAAEQPWFKVRVYDSATGASVNCASFTYVASGTLPGFTLSRKYGMYGGSIVYYKPWATASLNLSGQAGKTLVLEFTAADCSLGGHMGYGYVDVSCGLFAISSSTCNATSPLSAPPGFQSYTWYNSNFSTIVGTGQSITVPTPAAKTKYHVVLNPYSGYGCTDTLTTEIFGSTLAMNAGQDTAVCNASSVTLKPAVTGNAGPYKYAWTPSNGLSCTNCANPAASPSAITNYVVTVTDTLGCTKKDTVQVKPGPVVSATATPASCFGKTNGTLTATASNGKAPYTYSWNTTPAAATASVSGIAAGNYTVTAIDANGCSISAPATVAQPAQLIVSASSDSVSCNGSNNGRATVQVTGGKAPYSYRWNTAPVQTGATATMLTAGNYLVSITDSVGCTDSQAVSIKQALPLAASLQTSPASCGGTTGGSATITATGGTAPYTYALGTGSYGAGNTFSNLAAGTYILHIRDAKSCTIDSSITIAQPAAIRLNWTATQPLCFGAANGQITISPIGGTAPYQYALASGSFGSTASFANLAAGTFALHVRDAAGCQADTTVVLAQPQALRLSLTATNATCNGSANGSAAATATGGTQPYQYAINTGAFGSSASFSGLAAGTHVLHLRDAAGCTTDSTFTISQPASLSMSISSAAPACNGAANGSIQVSGNGGAAPYQLALNSGTFASATSFSALPAGSYVLHMRDAAGCTLDSNVQLQQPNALSATAIVTPVSCANGSNGAISITAIGGTAPYSYAINSGSFGSSSTLSSLPAGTYTVQVRDANACVTSNQVTVTQPAAVRLAWTATQPLCNGAANGQLTLNATGGTAPYQYAFGTGAFSSNAQATALAAGTFALHVRDAAGCQVDTTVVLAQPQALRLSLTATNATCNGSANGTAAATATGGTQPYQYAINTGAFGSSASFSGLAAGTHILHLRDAAGCTTDSTFTISQPASLSMNISSAAPACNGAANGSIQASGNGGAAPYQFALNSGTFASATSFSALPSGSYVLHMRDAAGCTLDSNVQLQQPNGLSAAFSVTPITCANSTNGAISITATGGTAPYTYAVNTGTYSSTASITSLVAGSYTIHVRDAKSCTIDSLITIAQPAAMRLTWTATQPLCNGAANGQIALSATGGTTPYQYAMNSGSFGSSAIMANLTAGSYTLHVRDAAGCQVDTATSLTQPQPLNIRLATTHVVCHGLPSGAVTGSATGGVAPYQFAINSGAFGSNPLFGALAAGSYILHVRDAAGCTRDSAFTVNQPAALAMSFVTNAPACNGSANGQIQVTGSGGVAPYQFAINTSAFGSAASFNSLSAATHIVHLRDAIGCTLDSTIVLQQPNSLNATITATAAACHGAATGSAQITATGGSTPYNYSWTGSTSTTATAAALPAGTYTATVTDSKGCIKSLSTTVSQPAAIAASLTTTAPACNGGANGTATAVVSGGTAPYSYAWNTATPQTGATATGLASGSYALTVTDAASCSTTLPVAVATTPAFQLSVIPQHPTCHGGSNGKAVAIVTGATGPFSYAWQGLTGQTTDTAHGLTASTYTVTVTTAAGCTATGSATVTDPKAIDIHVTTKATCNGAAQGAVSAIATGGTAPYHYQWNTVPSAPSATVSGLDAGSYRVIVTDKMGCKDSASASVPSQSGIEVSAGAETDTVCKGGSVQLTASGASSYSWYPANLLSCATCAVPVATPQRDTVFTVIGSDENGCRDTARVRVAVMQRNPARMAGSVRICQGQTATLSVQGGTSRVWLTANRETESEIRVTPQESGSYGVVVTENRCYSDTLYQQVDVLPAPSVEVDDNIQAALGADVTLRADMRNASSISWYPTQGLSCSDCPEPTHKIAGKAIYVAKVSNDLGCSATDTVRIADVCDERYFFFANMFSPNADGNNDRFYPQGTGAIRIDNFMIYNRWGEVVFSARNIEANDQNAGWDGTFRNQQLKPDVFVYVMDAVCESGKKIILRGDVTLVR